MCPLSLLSPPPAHVRLAGLMFCIQYTGLICMKCVGLCVDLGVVCICYAVDLGVISPHYAANSGAVPPTMRQTWAPSFHTHAFDTSVY